MSEWKLIYIHNNGVRKEIIESKLIINNSIIPAREPDESTNQLLKMIHELFHTF